jgi:acyl carrier protein
MRWTPPLRQLALYVFREKAMMQEAIEQQISVWLQSYLADLLCVRMDEIDLRAPFARLGLDSSAGIAMTGTLSEWLSQEVDPTVVYDYPTIAQLSAALARDAQVQQRLGTGKLQSSLASMR